MQNDGPEDTDNTDVSDDTEAREIKHGIGLGLLAGSGLLAVVLLVANLLSSGGFFVDGSGQFRVERVCKKTLQCVNGSTADQCRSRYEVLQDRDKLSKAQRRDRALLIKCLQGHNMESSCKSILDCVADHSTLTTKR
jgi:hypothetical protein